MLILLSRENMLSSFKNKGETSGDSNISLQTKVSILKSVGIFTETKEPALKLLAKSLVQLNVSAGGSIFKKGDTQRALYIIVEGLVKVHIDDHIFATFSNNQVFGEYSLIDASERSASVTTIKDSVLLTLDQATYHKINQKNPQISESILVFLIRRLRKYNDFEKLITQQKAEIEKQREELVHLNNTKDKFFSIIAHDIKNPFSTVLSLSKVMVEEFNEYTNEKRLGFASLIYQYANNTYTLLENLLQWASIQTGRLKILRKPINIGEIVNENFDLLKGNANNKKISLKNEVGPVLMAFADEHMVTTMLRNLISNAIKYTPIGGSISVFSSNTINTVKITVKDSGVGISPEDIKKLFRIDTNPTTIGTQAEKGTGLGLILCKEFVELNNGSITVTSSVGKGSEFTFELPSKVPN